MFWFVFLGCVALFVALSLAPLVGLNLGPSVWFVAGLFLGLAVLVRGEKIMAAMSMADTMWWVAFLGCVAGAILVHIAFWWLVYAISGALVRRCVNTKRRPKKDRWWWWYGFSGGGTASQYDYNDGVGGPYGPLRD
jgi:hypothetical protein